MAALEASVKEAKNARGRHPAAGSGTTKRAAKGKAKAAKKSRAKKSAAKTTKKAAKKAARVRKSA